VIAQLIGSVFGYAIVRACVMTSHLSNPEFFGVHFPHIGTEKALIIEFVITFVLILVICSIFDPRNAKNTGEIF
jgi:glycerol uptake facilitator-like aquaporin